MPRLKRGAVTADTLLHRRQTIRVGASVAVAQVGIVGFDGRVEFEGLRLFELPEAAPAMLYGCPTVPLGTREFDVETGLDLPSLRALRITIPSARQSDRA